MQLTIAALQVSRPVTGYLLPLWCAPPLLVTLLLFACCRSAVLRAAVPVLPAAVRSSVHLPRRVQDAAQGASLWHVPPVSLLLRSHSFGPTHGHGHPHPLPAAGLFHGPPALHRCCLLFQLLHCDLDHAGKLSRFSKHLQQTLLLPCLTLLLLSWPRSARGDVTSCCTVFDLCFAVPVLLVGV